MRVPEALLRNALVSGTIASAVGGAILALLARAEGASALQPINATSYWLHGADAGKGKTSMRGIPVPVSLLTTPLACWAALFETIRSAAPDAGPARIVRDAAAVSVIAAVVDYGPLPKRLSPGWGEPLPIRSLTGPCDRWPGHERSPALFWLIGARA